MSHLHRIELDLELLTDVCLSASNRTLGEPETHEYISGRMLWGAAANAAYKGGISEAEAFRLFHQGAIRVLDAVPVHKSGRAYPVPRAWHIPKGEGGLQMHNFALKEVRDGLAGTQCKPYGEGWVAPDGSLVTVEKSYSLRTSIDPSGRAREGLLYGLQVLRAGTRLWSAIVGEQPDVEIAARYLVGRDHHLGRSRSAELGVVRVIRRKTPLPLTPPGDGPARSVTFLCVSRCILRDPLTGAPTLIPTPEGFGLSGSWILDEASSFIRTARVVHFNAVRTRPETERFALERGSVVTFTSQTEVADLRSVSALVEVGVGEHRGEGYGEVLVAPAWLANPTVLLQEAGEREKWGASAPKDDLFNWAKDHAERRKRSLDLYEQANASADSLRKYRIPSAQWGELRRRAREARFNTGQARRLVEDVTKYLETGKRRLSDGWRRARPVLLEECRKREPDDVPMFLELLSSACMRRVEKSEE